MAPPSSEVAFSSPFSSSPRAHRGRKRAGMVAIPPALRPAWRRRLLLRLLLPLFLAVSHAAGVARADGAAHPTPSPVRDENVFDPYEWPVGPALEGLPRASANEDEGLLVATSSSSSCDGRDVALLRVSPWPGCGAQVTLALGWNVGSADDATTTPTPTPTTTTPPSSRPSARRAGTRARRSHTCRRTRECPPWRSRCPRTIHSPRRRCSTRRLRCSTRCREPRSSRCGRCPTLADDRGRSCWRTFASCVWAGGGTRAGR